MRELKIVVVDVVKGLAFWLCTGFTPDAGICHGFGQPTIRTHHSWGNGCQQCIDDAGPSTGVFHYVAWMQIAQHPGSLINPDDPDGSFETGSAWHGTHALKGVRAGGVYSPKGRFAICFNVSKALGQRLFDDQIVAILVQTHELCWLSARVV